MLVVIKKGNAIAVKSKPKPKAKRKRPAIIARVATGRPGPARYAPTSEQRGLVEGMVGAGLRRVDVASLMGISPTTLRAHFAAELRKGDAKAIYNVAMALYNNATSASKGHPHGNVTAQIFFLKCRAGWRETSRTEVTGPDGEPIAHAHEIKDLEKLPLAELARLYAQATAAPDRR